MSQRGICDNKDCATSGEIMLCPKCNIGLCALCYVKHTPCAIQLQTAKVADYATKKMELQWNVGELSKKLVEIVKRLSEISCDDTRQPAAVDARDEVVDALVKALTELQLLEHTPDAKQDLTSYMAQQQRADEVDAIGDKGQRYVVSCLGPESRTHTVGYATDNDAVITLIYSVLLHPSFHSPSVIDREAPKVPKPPLHTSDLWCAGYELALRSYAYWKDGIQYVGSTGKTLKEALIDMRKE